MIKKDYLSKAENWLLQEKYHFQKCANFYQDLRRIKKGEPIDYVIGFKQFLNCHIDLSLRPFIPREETEYWVEQAIKIIKDNHHSKSLNILDIFSGSGCIGIAILKHLHYSKVVFAEKSPQFIKQIRLNLYINKIPQERYQVVQSDIFSKITTKFNYIFANPPYLSEKRTKFIQKEVLLHEPRKALFSKEEGLFLIKKFLQEAKHYLLPQGTIFLEFDSWQKSKIQQFLRKFNYKFNYHNFTFYKDQFKHWRWIIIKNS